MKPFSLLVKPASADCNLCCEYCFYLGHRSFYPEEKKHRMSYETLETMIRSYMQTPQPQYVFTWQGGEPTLMGVDFFRRAVELQERYGREKNAVVANGLQTNGVLITDEMAELFARYRFLVGASLDGPVEIHDEYRTGPGGGSHADALRGIETLRKHNVEFNILILVSRANARRAAEVYRYLADQGFLFHQYIPCVEDGEGGAAAPFSISGDEWGDFLCGAFDEWCSRDTRRVSVRLFDCILNLLVDEKTTVCHQDTNCRQYFVVEYNGDVYPCDFFVEQRLKLGNVSSDPWDVMMDSSVYRQFGNQKKSWNEACEECEWLRICAGDCLKHRLPGRDEAPRSLSRLCGGWKRFFEHSMPGFRELAEEIKQQRREETLSRIDSKQISPGRNDPCPCGGGKKFKKCCGASE